MVLYIVSESCFIIDNVYLYLSFVNCFRIIYYIYLTLLISVKHLKFDNESIKFFFDKYLNFIGILFQSVLNINLHEKFPYINLKYP